MGWLEKISETNNQGKGGWNSRGLGITEHSNVAMTSEIQTKNNLWRNIVGEILKKSFVTVEI